MLVGQEEQECRICKANFTDKGTPVNELQVIFGQPITIVHGQLDNQQIVKNNLNSFKNNDLDAMSPVWFRSVPSLV